MEDKMEPKMKETKESWDEEVSRKGAEAHTTDNPKPAPKPKKPATEKKQQPVAITDLKPSEVIDLLAKNIKAVFKEAEPNTVFSISEKDVMKVAKRDRLPTTFMPGLQEVLSEKYKIFVDATDSGTFYLFKKAKKIAAKTLKGA